MTKSTDGVTWTTGTDVSGYSGYVAGLANGYFFVSNLATSATAYRLTTDPQSVAGTIQTGLTAANSSSGRWASASNGTSWMVISGNSGGTVTYYYGGANGTTTSNWTDASISKIVGSLCWSAYSNKYWYITNDGYLYFTATANTGLAAQTNTLATAVSWNASAQNFCMIAVGRYLYITSAQFASQYFIIDTDNPTTYATSSWNNMWTGYNPFGSNVVAPYQADSATFCPNGISGTLFGTISNAGAISVYVPSQNTNNPTTPPLTTCGFQRVNNTDIMSGGNGSNYGIFTSSNIVTTLPTWSNTGARFEESSANLKNKTFAYLGSTWYASSLTNAWTYTGSSITNLSGYSSAQLNILNIVPTVSTSYVITDGTYLNFFGVNAPLSISKVTTPTPYLGIGTVTANIVEIS